MSSSGKQMEVVVLVDELLKLQGLSKKYLRKVRGVKRLGFEGFVGEYRGQVVYALYSKLSSPSSFVKLEDLFLDIGVDVVVILGKCYALDRSRLPSGGVVIVESASAKSLSGEEKFDCKIVDKDIKRAAIDSAKALEIDVSVSNCFSVSNDVNYNEASSYEFECCDLVSYWLYDMASRFGKKCICFYMNLGLKYFDIHNYLIEKNSYSYDPVFKLALEFSLLWN